MTTELTSELLQSAGSEEATESALQAPVLVVAVAGNPNVGKTTVFNGLGGAAGETANYPGITVAAGSVETRWGDRDVELIDLPGIYGFGARSADEQLAWDALFTRRPDVVVAVVDATNLGRGLYLVLQLIDLGFRVVLALNMTDEAERRSLVLDEHRLQEDLGVRVIGTSALNGDGLGRLKKAVLDAAAVGGGGRARRYGEAAEARLEELTAGFSCFADECERPCAAVCGLHPRAAAFATIEGFGRVCDLPSMQLLLEHAHCHLPALAREDDAHLAVELAAERHETAARLAVAATGVRRPAPGDVAWRIVTRPLTGVPILLAVLVAMFAVLFFLGEALSTALTRLWELGPGPFLTQSVHSLFGAGALGETILWGLNGGVFATLAVAVPYIMTFYLMMAVLEDTGYVNAVAYLSDRLMRHVGLQGRAVIPLIAAAGCNVPAIMGSRVLTSRRERLIASTLITLVPCSARTAVIIGVVSLYVGWMWALAVYGVILAVGVAAGLGLNRLLPGSPSALVMETFPLRRPTPLLVLRKTWARLKDFVWVASPIVIGGSLALGALYETGVVWHLASPLSPIVEGWLGLPAVAGLTLVFAILRKELALQLLIAFAVVVYGSGAHDLLRFMTTDQLVVYAIVSCLYVPCAATVAVLARELGWKASAMISVGTIAIALLVGGVVRWLLLLF